MKRQKYAALLLFIAVLLSIVCFHSGINLKERVKPPSEMWGRHITLGVTEYRKPAVIYAEGVSTIVIFADEKGFQQVEIDDKGHIIGKSAIDISGYVPSRLVKYQHGRNKLFWTENYDLFYTELNGTGLAKKKLLSELLDFQIVEIGDSIKIIAASKDSVSVYNFLGNGLAELSAGYSAKDIGYISAGCDRNGSLHIAGVSRISPTEYKLRLFSYDSAAGKLVERVEPVAIENYTTTREGSNSLNNLELGFDDKDIYVFYEIGKASSQGLVARTYMGRIPVNSPKIEKLNFERLKFDGSSEQKETYISSLRCLKGSTRELSTVLITPIRTSVNREGSELVYMKLDDGKVKFKSLASNTGRWNTFAAIGKLDGQYSAVFLQALDMARYTVNFTSTAEQYKSNLNKTTFDDVKHSVMDTVGAYVFSFFAIFINLITVSFILLWPIAVDFFEWRFFFSRPLLTFRIGVLLETFMMYFSIDRIYRNPESVAFMPDILKHVLSPVAMLLATASMSYLIVRLYRKSKQDLHSFTELALFMLIHNIFVYFLYTAYIARF